MSKSLPRFGRSSATIWTSQVVLVVKNLPANAGGVRDSGLIPRPGRSPEGGHGIPLHYSCLENLMDRGAWQATVHRVTKSQTWLKRLNSSSSHYFFKISAPFSLSSPSETLIMYRLYSSCRLSLLLFILFSLFSSDWIIQNCLSSEILPSADVLYYIFFISYIVVFCSRISVWFFYDFYLCVKLVFFVYFIELPFCVFL